MLVVHSPTHSPSWFTCRVAACGLVVMVGVESSQLQQPWASHIQCYGQNL